jgi:hypothetical protein
MTKRLQKLQIATEKQEQRAIVKWLSVHRKLSRYYFKITNEGNRTPAQARNLKLEGLRPGVSDIFIAYPTSIHHGLFLEVKRNMNYPPSAKNSETWLLQEEWLTRVKSVGFEGRFCYGFDDAIKIIEEYLHADVIL